MNNLRRIRTTVFVGAMALFAFGTARERVAARGGNVCSEMCSASSSCGDVCYPTQFDFDQDQNATTCGNSGGWENYTCDPDWDSCSYLCPVSSSGTSCNSSGGSTNCGSYGVYRNNCGDGVCQLDYEDDVSCSADCEAMPVNDFDWDNDAGARSDVQALILDINSAMPADPNNMTMDDVETLLGLLSSYGFASPPSVPSTGGMVDGGGCSGYCTTGWFFGTSCSSQIGLANVLSGIALGLVVAAAIVVTGGAAAIALGATSISSGAVAGAGTFLLTGAGVTAGASVVALKAPCK